MNELLGGWAIEKALLNAIVSLLKPGITIVEFGSGSGTIELLNYFKVISIEHNKEYVIKRSPSHNIYHAPIVKGWYKRSVVKQVLSENKAHCILVDGPPKMDRINIVNNLDLFNGFKGTIIFDDIDRNEDYLMCLHVCKILGYEMEILKGDVKYFGFCTKRF